jgi:hypothetical protein
MNRPNMGFMQMTKLEQKLFRMETVKGTSRGDDPWSIDDRRWFKRNPARSHRLRPLFDGEDEFNTLGEPPPNFAHWMIIRQLAPGARVRHSVLVVPEVAADAAEVEAVVHDLYELLIFDGTTDVPIGVREVAQRALGLS